MPNPPFEGESELVISSPNGDLWVVLGANASFFINGVLAGIYDGESDLVITVGQMDIITVTASEGITAANGLRLNVRMDSEHIWEWYVSAYSFPYIISANPCQSRLPLKYPFGRNGQYPTLPNQVIDFSKSIRAPEFVMP